MTAESECLPDDRALYRVCRATQLAFSYSKLTIETPEQGANGVVLVSLLF